LRDRGAGLPNLESVWRPSLVTSRSREATVRALRSWVCIAFAASVACSGAAGDKNIEAHGSHRSLTGWAIGYYFAPEYLNGAEPDRPPMGITFAADGSWSHTSSGLTDASGEWSYLGFEVAINGVALERSSNCALINYQGRKYYRDDATIPGCPDRTEPLTEVEKCLTGRFEVRRTLNTTVEIFTKARKANRLEVYEQVYSGGEDSHFTLLDLWRVSDERLCYEEGGCWPLDWAEIETSRATPKDPGCRLPAGASTAFCMATMGVSASGSGCQTWNVGGPSNYLLSCDEPGNTCDCTNGNKLIWSGRAGNHDSCDVTVQPLAPGGERAARG